MSNHVNPAAEKASKRSRVKENRELRPTRRGGQNKRIERSQGRLQLFQVLQKVRIRKGLDLKVPKFNPEAPAFIPQHMTIPDSHFPISVVFEFEYEAPQSYEPILVAPTPVKPWVFAPHFEKYNLDPDAPTFYPSLPTQHLSEEPQLVVSVCHCNSAAHPAETSAVKDAEEVGNAGANFRRTVSHSSTSGHTRCWSVSIPEKPEWKVIVDEPVARPDGSNEQVTDTKASPDEPAIETTKEQSGDTIPASQAVARKVEKVDISSKNTETSPRPSKAKLPIASSPKQQPSLSGKGKEGKNGRPLIKAKKLSVSKSAQTTKTLPVKSTLPISNRKALLRSAPSLVAKSTPLKSAPTSTSQSLKPPLSTSQIQTGSKLALPTASSRSRSLNDSVKSSPLQARKTASTVAAGKTPPAPLQKSLLRSTSRLPKAGPPIAKKTETRKPAKSTPSEPSRGAVARQALGAEKTRKASPSNDQQRKDSSLSAKPKRKLTVLEVLDLISVTGNCWL